MGDASYLASEHYDSVFRYLSRIVGQVEAARDLTQEVFLRVSRGSVPVASDLEQRAWVFRIARNLAINHLRDGRRRPRAVALSDRPMSAPQELAAALQEALAALPDVDRDVFLLRESAGLSYDEIAAACELTIDAVRMRLHRARTALRAALGRPIAEQAARGVSLTFGHRDGRGPHD